MQRTGIVTDYSVCFNRRGCPAIFFCLFKKTQYIYAFLLLMFGTIPDTLKKGIGFFVFLPTFEITRQLQNCTCTIITTRYPPVSGNFLIIKSNT